MASYYCRSTALVPPKKRQCVVPMDGALYLQVADSAPTHSAGMHLLKAKLLQSPEHLRNDEYSSWAAHR